MFIWDFAADTVLKQILDWVYGQIIGFLGNFFSVMGNMGADLFEMNWVQSIVLFFVYLAGRCMARDWWCRFLNAALNTSPAGEASRTQR